MGPTTSPRDQHFQELLARFRQGDEDAATELYDHFQGAILPVVRYLLSHRLRRMYDSTDFCQSVLRAALTKLRNEDLPREQVIALLKQIARNKVASAARRHLGGKHLNENNRQSLEDVAATGEDRLASREPPPEANARLQDTMDALSACRSEIRRVLELLSQGCTHEEIADRLGRPQRYIDRLIAKLRRQPLPA